MKAVPVNSYMLAAKEFAVENGWEVMREGLNGEVVVRTRDVLYSVARSANTGIRSWRKESDRLRLKYNTYDPFISVVLETYA